MTGLQDEWEENLVSKSISRTWYLKMYESPTMLGPSGAHRIILWVGRDSWRPSSPTLCSLQGCTKLNYWQNFSISRLPSPVLLGCGACFRLPCWKCDTKNDNPRRRNTGFRVLAFLEGSVDIKESLFSAPSESQADREVFYSFLGTQFVPVQGRTCPGCAGSSCLCVLTLPMSKQKMPLCFFPLFTIPASLGEALGTGIVWW